MGLRLGPGLGLGLGLGVRLRVRARVRVSFRARARVGVRVRFREEARALGRSIAARDDGGLASRGEHHRDAVASARRRVAVGVAAL